ncbi:hypothetical protein Pyrde_1202 [Pyrodictium delaneyi]|uniref:CARDB domain-containing protein n=1 Tax=Pyrodictium delaneyi TaxID=1273541 RepID=A0A0P0N498_9CREN|nr:CARDB domain-containing protein [Pyrodictium delaneyi]ALL01250.1 hypothetical protein Pyrde_1202 [Pyrodictium delaneyi]OWJ55676.1 hypothetical protein Pdsh_02530 [Pyrodictium delaneyi]
MRRTIAALLAGILALISIAALSANAQDAQETYTVELRLGDDLYVLYINMSTGYFVETSSTLYMKMNIRLAYSTSAEPVFVSVEASLAGVAIGSSMAGYLSDQTPTREIVISGIVPPHVAEQITYHSGLSFIEVKVKAYRGNEKAVQTIMVPVVVVKKEPSISVDAFFDNGSPYTVAVIGRDMFRKIVVRVANTGEIQARNLKVSILLGNNTVYTGTVATILEPGEQAETEATIPVPVQPGVYTLTVSARAIVGAVSYEKSTSLIMAVIPRPVIQLVLVNSTPVLEGEKVCFTIYVNGVPEFADPNIVLEYSAPGAGQDQWNPVYVKKGRENVSYCWEARTAGDRTTAYLFRAKLLLRIYGLEYASYSNTVQVTVTPITSVLSRSSLQLVVVPSMIYEGGEARAVVTLSPTLPGCLTGRLEALDTQTLTWTPLKQINICDGKGIVNIFASELGVGNHTLRAVVQLGSYTIASNAASIRIVAKPELVARLVPPIAAPGSSTELLVKVDPAIREYRVSIKPSWMDNWINTTGKPGGVTVPLLAPDKEGVYDVRIEVAINGVKLEKTLVLTVQKLLLLVAAEPQKLRAGEVDTINVKATLSAPLNGTAVFTLSRGNTVIDSTEKLMVDGKAVAKLTAPKEPGVYTIKVFVPEYRIENTTLVNVTKMMYGITLTLNATKTEPNGKIETRIEIQPKPTSPVNLVLMIQYPDGVWRTLVSKLVSSNEATIVIDAPSEPGTYRVKATIPSVNAESNVVTLEVTGRAVKEIVPANMLPTVIAGAATIAILWSIRAIRKR